MWSYIVFVAVSVAGFRWGWSAVMRSRAPYEADYVLLSWEQPKEPTWRIDPTIATFLYFHTLASLGMGLLVLPAIQLVEPTPSNIP